MVICLKRGADLHMAQLMPLPLTVSCFSKIQIDFTFLVQDHPGSPGKRAAECVCVCVCVCYIHLIYCDRPPALLMLRPMAQDKYDCYYYVSAWKASCTSPRQNKSRRPVTDMLHQLTESLSCSLRNAMVSSVVPSAVSALK